MESAGPPQDAAALLPLLEMMSSLPQGDRDRLSNLLYEYSQLLDNGEALQTKVRQEFTKINQDKESFAVVENVDAHVKALHDITPLASSYS